MYHQKGCCKVSLNKNKQNKQKVYLCKFQTKKNSKGRCFIVKNVQIKNISEVVEITKNPANPL